MDTTRTYLRVMQGVLARSKVKSMLVDICSNSCVS